MSFTNNVFGRNDIAAVEQWVIWTMTESTKRSVNRCRGCHWWSPPHPGPTSRDRFPGRRHWRFRRVHKEIPSPRPASTRRQLTPSSRSGQVLRQSRPSRREDSTKRPAPRRPVPWTREECCCRIWGFFVGIPQNVDQSFQFFRNHETLGKKTPKLMKNYAQYFEEKVEIREAKYKQYQFIKSAISINQSINRSINKSLNRLINQQIKPVIVSESKLHLLFNAHLISMSRSVRRANMTAFL